MQLLAYVALIALPTLALAAPGDTPPLDYTDSAKLATYMESFATTYEARPAIENLMLGNGYGTYDGWGLNGLIELTGSNPELLVGTNSTYECDRYCTTPGLYRNCNPNPAMQNTTACYSACMTNCQSSNGVCMYMSVGDNADLESAWGTQCCISNSTWQSLKANGDSCGISYEETTTTSTTTLEPPSTTTSEPPSTTTSEPASTTTTTATITTTPSGTTTTTQRQTIWDIIKKILCQTHHYSYCD